MNQDVLQNSLDESTYHLFQEVSVFHGRTPQILQNSGIFHMNTFTQKILLQLYRI